MPTVPTVSGQTVQTAPVGLNALDASPTPAAFGAGIGVGLGAAAATLGAAEAEARADAEDVAVTGRLATLRKRRIDDFHAKGTGLAYQNFDALSVNGDKALDGYDKLIGELRAGLPSEAARRAFDRRAINERLNYDEALQTRFGAERIRKEDDTLAFSLETLQADAALSDVAFEMTSAGGGGVALDDRAVRRKINEIGVTIGGYARRNKDRLQPHEFEEMERKAVSAVHASVLDKLRAQDDERLAAAYYEKHKDALTAGERAFNEKAIAEASFTGATQRAEDLYFRSHYDADAVMGGTGTIAEQKRAALEAVRVEMPEGKERDEVLRRLKVRFDEAAESKAQDESESLAALSSRVLAKESMDSISKTREYALLPTQAKADLESLSRLGTAVESDPALWSELTLMAGDPLLADEFLKRDIRGFATARKLSEPDARAFLKQQADLATALGRGAAAGDADARAEADALVKTSRDEAEIIGHASRILIGKPSAEKYDINDIKRDVAFRRSVAATITEQQIAKKRPLTPPEVQEIVDAQMATAVQTPTGPRELSKPVFEWTPADVDLEVIDPDEVQAIRLALVRTNTPMSEANIKLLYLKRLRQSADPVDAPTNEERSDAEAERAWQEFMLSERDRLEGR